MVSHQIPNQDDQSGLIRRFYLSCEFHSKGVIYLGSNTMKLKIFHKHCYAIILPVTESICVVFGLFFALMKKQN